MSVACDATEENPQSDPGSSCSLLCSDCLYPEMTLSPIACAAAGSGFCQEPRSSVRVVQERRGQRERTRPAHQIHVGRA